MRRLLCCLPLVTACAAAPLGPGHLGWDASPARVAAAEAGTPIVRTEDRLVYHRQLAGIAMTVVYHFSDRRLTAMRCLNREGHDDRNRYIRDYERLRARLSERFGPPVFDRKQWRRPLFRDDPERHGDAIAAGHLVYLAEWRTRDTEVAMTLRSDRLAIAHELVFRPADEH